MGIEDGIVLPARRLLCTGALLAMFGVLLAACGSAAPTKVTIAGVMADTSDPYFITMQCGAEAAAKALHVKLTWQGPTLIDTPAEVATLSTVELTKPSGIVLMAFSPTAFVAQVKKLMSGGTPVVLPDGSLSSKVAYQNIVTDTTQAGDLLAKELSGEVGAHGTIAIIAATASDPVDRSRWTGFVSVMKKAHPGVTILPVQYASADANTAASDTVALLEAHPNINAIYATDGPDGEGVVAGLKSVHKVGIVKVVAFDATPEEVSDVKAGYITGLVAQAPFQKGYDAVHTLVSYIRSHKAGASVSPAHDYFPTTPVKFITRANVNNPSSLPFEYRSSCPS
jgi:ribose transport system substrate-binding protein